MAPPPPQTYNATSAAGAPVQLLPEANKTCGAPACTVYVLVNGTKYNVSDTVNMPVGNTTVTYVIVDALGKTDNDTRTVTVLPPGYVHMLGLVFLPSLHASFLSTASLPWVESRLTPECLSTNGMCSS